METMNKKERRQAQLDRHYAALVRLAKACGVKADGKKLSVSLLHIERVAHAGATAYCNGEVYRCMGKYGSGHFNFNADENAWDRFSTMIEREVQVLFVMLPPFFYVNADARGYALKIRGAEAGNDYGRELIEKTGLQRDWGGNGLLAPEITGN